MALIPFRRRGKLSQAAQNLALAEAALALARGRGSSSGRRRGRTLLLGGVAAALAAGLFWKRDKVAGLIPSRTGEGAGGYEPPAPGPSNYDAPGPVANTATPVPAPEGQTPGAVDERAEEAAAAAEAANIGGQVSDYAGPADLPATEAERPLAEAGQGEAEGQEQAERDLEQAAQPTAPGMSDTERQIEDAIEAAENPALGETVEPVAPVEEPTPAETTPSEAPATPSESSADETRSSEPDETRSSEADVTKSSAADETTSGDEPDEGGSDWRTWSGRSVNP